jgi:hypothetical protein
MNRFGIMASIFSPSRFVPSHYGFDPNTCSGNS